MNARQLTRNTAALLGAAAIVLVLWLPDPLAPAALVGTTLSPATLTPTWSPDVSAAARKASPPLAAPPLPAPRIAPLAGCNNLLQDPSFEAFTPNPYWIETSTNFGTPLCTTAACGTGGGTAGPRTGSVWAWLGGTISNEVASLTQAVSIPSGTATLEFYLWIGVASPGSGPDDVFSAQIDSTTLFTANATQSGVYPAYTLVSLNANAFADGGVHTVRLAATTSGQLVNFNLDDVGVCSVSQSASVIYLPIIIKPSPPPPEGHWTGTTSRGYPMSFDVSSGGATWSNFKLKTDFVIGGCSGTLETTSGGPGPITNNQFGGGGFTFSFSGQLTSLTTASGTYDYDNQFIPSCGYLTQSGTWTANVP